MLQYLVVAARNHPELYGYLRRQFAGDHRVQVLLDRRYEERRRPGDPAKPDRRKGERRGGRGKDNGLDYHGFVVIRQSSGVQWRPPWWGGAVANGCTEAESGGSAGSVDARAVVAGWVGEGQRLLNIVPKLLREHEQLAAAVQAAERKCERCEEEIRSLRNENERFRKERRQTVDTLNGLTKQLIESAATTAAPHP